MNWLDALQLSVFRKVPIVYQSEASECGLACIAMVAAYFGHRADMSELRRDHGASQRGARLNDLMQIADRMGMGTRALRLELNEMDQLRTPCVLHWDMNHFVVLVKVGARSITIHDPAVGVRKISHKDASKHFTGVALEMGPSPSFQKKKKLRQLRIRDAIGTTIGLKGAMAKILIVALAMELLALLMPLLTQWVVDHAIVSDDKDLLLALALGFGLVTILKIAFSTIRGWMILSVSTLLKAQGKSGLFNHLLKLPSGFIESRHLGDLVSRFGSLEKMQETLTTELVAGIMDGLLAALTLALMFMFSPVLSFMVLGALLLYGMVRYLSYNGIRESTMEAIIWDAKQDSYLLETLRAFGTVKLLGGQSSRRAHWGNILTQSFNRHITMQKLGLVVQAANGILFGILAILVIWYGATLVLSNQLTVGMLMAFVAYQGQFVQRVSSLVDKYCDLRMLDLHTERLADLALAEREPEQRSAPSQEAFAGALEAKSLSFSYSLNEPEVLSEVSFRIEPGESVAIVGTSGCGKTTLLKLLTSLLSPTKGSIEVGGRSVAHWGLETYRKHIGVVMQDDHLLAGSIADNITFFSAKPDLNRLLKCAQAAAIHEDILAMPMAYESMIGDMGSSLSGGQKQRVLIARALYRRPKILFMDEATSHLDLELEKQVNDAIRRMQITRVVVAHRPNTIQSADRVIELEAGRIRRDYRKVKNAA